MKSREFKKIYHPAVGRYIFEHRGNGLIVDNIMKPLRNETIDHAPFLKQTLRAVLNRSPINLSKPYMELELSGPKVKRKGKVKEKSGEIIMKRLRGKSPKAKETKRSLGEINKMVNNLLAR